MKPPLVMLECPDPVVSSTSRRSPGPQVRRHGLAAPADMAVVGVHDSAAAALADPTLTTVAVDAPATARSNVGVITALLDGWSAPEPSTDVATLVQRGSG